MKRKAEFQLTKDNYAQEYESKPLKFGLPKASEEELAKRKRVKVKRKEGGDLKTVEEPKMDDFDFSGFSYENEKKDDKFPSPFNEKFSFDFAAPKEDDTIEEIQGFSSFIDDSGVEEKKEKEEEKKEEKEKEEEDPYATLMAENRALKEKLRRMSGQEERNTPPKKRKKKAVDNTFGQPEVEEEEKEVDIGEFAPATGDDFNLTFPSLEGEKTTGGDAGTFSLSMTTPSKGTDFDVDFASPFLKPSGDGKDDFGLEKLEDDWSKIDYSLESSKKEIGSEVVGSDVPDTLEVVPKFPEFKKTDYAHKTGEEEEESVLNALVKLYRLVDGGKRFSERGRGKVHLNRTKAGKFRLVMRRDESYTLVLNMPIYANFPIERIGDKKISFHGFDYSGLDDEQSGEKDKKEVEGQTFLFYFRNKGGCDEFFDKFNEMVSGKKPEKKKEEKDLVQPPPID